MADSHHRFLFEYRHEGAEWALEVRARDLDDAKARLRAIPWSKFKGEIVASGRIPDGGVARWFSGLFRSRYKDA